ncbi:MAG: hypothetical protein GKC10_04725 [Methanosarcinales archaeon]|nr:hypothetical protein [Methanosarcinales archaeon]
MIHKGNRTKGGTMSLDLQQKVDDLLAEFVTLVNEISDSRHLQRGIARSSLPCSLVAVLDRASLFILAQLRNHNLSSTYLYTPEVKLVADKAMSAAKWQFGFDDPFVLQFPAEMLDQKAEERREFLQKMAEEHVDSEFLRFRGFLNLLRTKPIFGPAPFAADDNLLVVLTSPGPQGTAVFMQVESAAISRKLAVRHVSGLKTNIAVRQAWQSIGMARLVVADLSSQDPDVSYALGLAHSVGKESILLYPEDGEPPVELPGTRAIAFKNDEPGLAKLSQDVAMAMESVLQPLD